MAARDMFESFNASLTLSERELLRVLIIAKREELLVSRSEDARVRVAREYIQEAREALDEAA